jgi:hypothetical protein
MAKHKELIASARKEIDLADHLLYVTYPLVKETKFLLAITEHVISSAQKALQALLEYEYYYKRARMCPPNFALQISAFRDKIEKRYEFDPTFFRLLKKLLEIHKFEKDSIVRFKRGDKYILTTGEYNHITVLDMDNVKRYLNFTKKFVAKIEPIVMKDD